MSYIEVNGRRYVDEPGLIGDDGEFTRPPQVYNEPPESIMIQRRDVARIFVNNSSLSQFENWTNSSKIVDKYFNTEEITTDAETLAIIQSLINQAETDGHLSGQTLTDLRAFFTARQAEVG